MCVLLCILFVFIVLDKRSVNKTQTYAIPQNSCREQVQDVRKLLRDTGVGKDSNKNIPITDEALVYLLRVCMRYNLIKEIKLLRGFQISPV